MSGEIDRRVAERDAADRRYNDALTNLDRALPELPEPAVTPTLPSFDTRALRDRIVVLPPSPPVESGWRGRLAGFIWRLVAPLFARQQEFNAHAVTHLDAMAEAVRGLAAAIPGARGAQRAELEAFLSFNSVLIQYLQQITPFIDTKTRVVEASLDEVRMAAAAAQRAAIAARRQLDSLSGVGVATTSTAGNASASDARLEAVQPSGSAHGLGSRYVGFEDLFRGSSEAIQARQRDYADRFAGASDVLDLGCGRGEFLALLRERGVSAMGIDANAEMVDACRAQGLRADHVDALAYLTGLPDESLGGLSAFQVVEHFEPEYLVRVLEAAHAKLRPGATLVLETINAACWVAFFESYVRDITHVRPLHPDTLKFLTVAAGFERVDVHFRSPVAASGRLQRIDAAGLSGEMAALAQTINANVERLNDRLFTYLDYAVIGEKGR